MASSSVPKLYYSVIEDVIANVREDFIDEGVDEQALTELKMVWERKLHESKAIEKEPEVIINKVQPLQPVQQVTSSVGPTASITHQLTMPPANLVQQTLLQYSQGSSDGPKTMALNLPQKLTLTMPAHIAQSGLQTIVAAPGSTTLSIPPELASLFQGGNVIASTHSNNLQHGGQQIAGVHYQTLTSEQLKNAQQFTVAIPVTTQQSQTCDLAMTPEVQQHDRGKARDTYHFKILVPSVAAGAIIGKRGGTIAQLQEETAAKVQMSKATEFYPGTTERVCLITGSVESILRILEFIMEKIIEKPDPKPVPHKPPGEREKQVKILVPNSTAGMIIGRSGCYIKHIKETSGVYIQISQKPKDYALPERCITIFGEMENNKTACRMILEKIVDDPNCKNSLNISYADVTGPLANSNPTGSPFVDHSFLHSDDMNNSNNGFNSNGSVTSLSPALTNITGVGIGDSVIPSANADQVIENVETVLRGNGYSEQVVSEVSAAMNTLGNYGILGQIGMLNEVSGFGMESAATSCQKSPGDMANEENMYTSATGMPELAAIFEQYCKTSSPSAAALPVNNNSFGLETGPSSLKKRFAPRDRQDNTKVEIEVGENVIGAILGPGGKTHLDIQQFSGANVQISKKGIFAPGTHNRIVTITGSYNAVNTAQYIIGQQIAQKQAKWVR